jgi:glycosyltransferase involved in cell wall biosynthesis
VNSVIDSDVGVVVRMYNEASRVGAVITELREHFGLVVAVDDGSSDGSGAVASAAGAVVVRHAQNLGGGAALETGFAYMRTRSDITWCVTFDADGQHRVEDALAMVRCAREERVDVVLASRFAGSSTNMPWTRRVVLRAATTFTRWTNHLDVSDTHNGLRVFRRDALLKFRVTHAGMAYASELMAAIRRHSLTWTEVPVTILYDDYSLAKGQSSLNAVNILFDLTIAKLRTSR